MIKITLEVELQFGTDEPDPENTAASLASEVAALIEGDPDEVLDLDDDQAVEKVDVVVTKWEALP